MNYPIFYFQGSVPVGVINISTGFTTTGQKPTGRSGGTIVISPLTPVPVVNQTYIYDNFLMLKRIA
jgi:hypothetical protein